MPIIRHVKQYYNILTYFERAVRRNKRKIRFIVI